MPRGRPPNINPSLAKEISFDAELITRLDLLLYSEVEERVPKGAYQRFFNALLRRHFELERLDLAPYLGELPGESEVWAPPTVVTKLKALLERRGSDEAFVHLRP